MGKVTLWVLLKVDRTGIISMQLWQAYLKSVLKSDILTWSLVYAIVPLRLTESYTQNWAGAQHIPALSLEEACHLCYIVVVCFRLLPHY